MPTDVTRLIDHVHPPASTDWACAPTGWPDEIEAALIDSVMGIRATYGSPTTGVRATVARWRRHEHPRPLDDLMLLADLDPTDLAQVLENRQRLTGGPLKTAGIVEAATRLLDVGVRHAADLDPDDAAHRAAYEDVAGLGPVTWKYLTMMLGCPGGDADWLADFASASLTRPVCAAEALDLVQSAATSAGIDPTRVLRAIWVRQRH